MLYRMFANKGLFLSNMPIDSGQQVIKKCTVCLFNSKLQGMTRTSLTIMIIFNSSCFLLGLILYIIPIMRMDDPTHMPAVQLCAGELS